MMEPDQIDMMPEHESRFQLRELVKELTTLRAKAKAYNEGQWLWVSFDVETDEPYAIDRDPAITIHDTWKLLGRHPQGNMPGGFVNRKVRVCKEVVVE